MKKDGVTYRVELQKDRIVAREFYSRRLHEMTLTQIVDVLTGQLPLKLN